MPHAAIRDLALIGDRRTAALLDRHGSVVWYCPARFDAPSLLAALLDSDKGGVWRLELPQSTPLTRRYVDDSGMLETVLSCPKGTLTVTDFMPYGEGLPQGLCRRFTAAPRDLTFYLTPAPNYAQQQPSFRQDPHSVTVDGKHTLYASHPLRLEGNTLSCLIPAGEGGWAALLDTADLKLNAGVLEAYLASTQRAWQDLAQHSSYKGLYEREVADSLRALRFLTFEANGGIIAAPTASLPEVLGGERNYDYRYVWLRDAAMIVSALTRSGTGLHEARRFLDFICATEPVDGLPLAPFSTLEGKAIPPERELPLAGYRDSRPVRIGNGARLQLQLDAYGNVLLAAKLLYARIDDRPHWALVADLADYLCEHWREPEYGLWEEREKRQYTVGKVITACGLASVADYTTDAAQRRRWRESVADIRRYVARECLTPKGAYAAVAGEDAVDVSAALFPVWGYTAPDSPEMLATMRALERDHSSAGLYRRHLELTDAAAEGAFLAGTFWVAQYWVMRRDFTKAEGILEAALAYANDVGLFAEEADPASGLMLGNFPQSFVHAAFIGAVIDLKAARQDG